MKNKPFPQRLGFALRGVQEAWRTEASFRVHTVMSVGALGILPVLGAKPIWWAAFLLVIGGVLSAELLNTALERIADRLHPETHPLIASAKDCAAGAVLVLSMVAVGIFLALLADLYL